MRDTKHEVTSRKEKNMTEIVDDITQKKDKSNKKRKEFIAKLNELKKLNLTKEKLISEMKKEFSDKFTDAEIEELLKK